MTNWNAFVAASLGGILFTSAALAQPLRDVHPLSVDWFTESVPSQNVDSPAAWHGGNGRDWLLVTAKAGECVRIYNAFDGSPIETIGEKGTGAGQMLRPNGIWVEGDLMFVVERDNARVQVFHLPEGRAIGSFGEKDLSRPYGLTVISNGEGSYTVYVTDNYETAAGEKVPVSEMDHRVREYSLSVADGKLDSELVNSFGDTSGAGVLNVVESIVADPARGRLLVADEDETTPGAHNVKLYTLDGHFTGKTIGDGLYVHQAEGIAMLYADPSEQRWQDAGIDGRSYYFLTDQGMDVNYYHVFDADTLSYLGSIELSDTLNTDGVWLDPTASERFPLGAFYAVDNDRRVGATDLAKFLEVLKKK